MAQRGQSPLEAQQELEAYRDRLAREKSRQEMIRRLRWPLVCAVLCVIIVALIFVLMSDRPKEWVDDLRGIDVADPVQYVYPTPTPVPTATPNPTATPTSTPTPTPTGIITPKATHRPDGHGFYGKVTDSNNNLIGAGASIEARIENIHFAQSVDSATDSSTQNTVTHAARSGLNFGVLTNFQVCGDDVATTAKEGGTKADSITFYVGGVTAWIIEIGDVATSRSSITFESMASTKLHLRIPSLDATQTAATASTVACSEQAATTPTAATPIPRF